MAYRDVATTQELPAWVDQFTEKFREFARVMTDQYKVYVEVVRPSLLAWDEMVKAEQLRMRRMHSMYRRKKRGW